MSKRKLTLQQIRHIQSTREKRKSKQVSEGDFGEAQNGTVIAHFGKTLDVEDCNGEIIQCHYRQNLGAIVTGDKVIWQTQNSSEYGLVSERLPRHGVLARPSRFQPEPKLVAANIDQIVIVIAVEPAPVEHYIDRYFVAAHAMGIQPVLVLNKIDLLNTHNREYFERLCSIYQNLGYPVYQLSALSQQKDETLSQILMGKTSIFAGQSGVGKSELLNYLFGDQIARTSAISAQNQRGRHTTTTARLYHVNDSSHVIDSPGIREFGIWHLNAEDIFNGFTEFAEHIGQCQFRNCDHSEHAKGCAVAEAVNQGKINAQRFKNYHRLMYELHNEQETY